MTNYYFLIDYTMLDKGIPVEDGQFPFKAVNPNPANEAKNHLRAIKFNGEFGVGIGIGKEFLFRLIKPITEQEFMKINASIVLGHKI